MRTIFFGTPALAVPTLAAVAQHHDLTAVVCQPDKPKGRSKKLIPPPVKVWAQEHGIPVHQPAKLNDGTFEAWLKEQHPDVGVVAAYGRLLKQSIIDIPKKGWLNVHPSLLPRWRGPSPIRTAILEGDTETGVTIMRLVLEMDAGDIVLQEKTPIALDEDGATLTARLAEMGGRMMVQALEQLENDTLICTPQDPDLVTFCRMFEKADGRIQWTDTAVQIHNRVRAAQPWPVAQCLWNGQVCKIHQSAVVDTPTEELPGTITHVLKDRIHVATGEGQLAILKFQLPGKKAMDMEAFLRGHTLEAGNRFEDFS